MCGITALIGARPPTDVAKQHLRALVVSASKELRHRGPDWSGVVVQDVNRLSDKFVNVLAHERLAIVDPVGGAQPLTNQANTVALTVNGEIFNHLQLKATLKKAPVFKTGSDCEVILHLYDEVDHEAELATALDGYFAFVVSDLARAQVIVGRDPIGIMPLFWGHKKMDNTIWFASEIKALINNCDEFSIFPPGHVCCFKVGADKDTVRNSIKRYYNPIWWDNKFIPTTPLDLTLLRTTLENAVRKRLMADVPFGVLLSGGLDSSLIAAITAQELAKNPIRKDDSFLHTDKLHSFTIGLSCPDGQSISPDIVAAREVAAHIGTVHHEFQFELDEGLDAISDVIRFMETYDVTTIRAGTAMYLLARRIKALGIKMVLSGEGADEVFGGYLYFHKAPNAREFHLETLRKIDMLHYYDVLRANKSTSAVGVEVRVPFLDKDFLNVAMMIDPKYKMVNEDTQFIEKFILRKAFANPDKPLIPDSVLFRQKEQFSDGVGYSWIGSLKAHAEKMIHDDEMVHVSAEFAYNTPTTKEALWYRRIFAQHFPGRSAALTMPPNLSSTIACSTPTALEWDASFKKSVDPSGLSIMDVHTAKRRKLQ
eukprot:c13406_g1_i1.p1 GENE.c13406_g1_i1~~c13406_g1_i1.p1  ORF type:complete len:611 (+),score=164.38 c13406_g1_i1:47-1834(+)